MQYTAPCSLHLLNIVTHLDLRVTISGKGDWGVKNDYHYEN
jgi:hypothetical protein